MTFGMAASASMFYIAIEYKNKTYTKVASNNINIKIYQMFSKQWILGAGVTTVQGNLRGLGTTLPLNNVQTILVKII